MAQQSLPSPFELGRRRQKDRRLTTTIAGMMMMMGKVRTLRTRESAPWCARSIGELFGNHRHAIHFSLGHRVVATAITETTFYICK